MIRKYLSYCGYKVKYVVNITDIDDKIIKIALEEKKEPREVAECYTQAFFEVMEKLGVQPADLHPRATEHIKGMIDLITGLVEKGHAYSVASTDLGNDVYLIPPPFPLTANYPGKTWKSSKKARELKKTRKK